MTNMVFVNEISIADIISIISIILVIIGGMFAFYQWYKSTILKRAEYINELTEKIRTDKYIKTTMYLLEYEDEWYCDEFHNSGKLELKVDKTLSYFSYICYLKSQKIISKKEFYFFEYEIESILNNSQVVDYLYNLYHYSQYRGCPITFEYLFRYGQKRRKFDDDFYDKTSYQRNKKYHKYLIF